MTREYRIDEGKKVNLSSFDTDYRGSLTKEELKNETAKNIDEIDRLQFKFYAESKNALLIILQAMDAAGKDGTIRKVFGMINPQGCRVTSFKAPSVEEKSHDFLWRIHREVPKKGMIGIFNRSHYEDVLIVRVHDWIDAKECEKRLRIINDFEKMLHDEGTKIVKLFLHISKDEQKKRFEKRLHDRERNWKFSKMDVQERKLWDKYMGQYEEVLSGTSGEHAPWYVIPADNKTFRNYLVSEIVKKTLEKIDPKFPEPEEGLENIVVE